MKATKYLGALAVIAMFAACSSEDELTGVSDRTDEVKINATVGSGSVFTRTNPAGTQEEQTQFNEDDKISVSDGKTAVVYQKTADGNWASADGSYLKWESANMTFRAFYPAIGLEEYEAEKPTVSANSYDQGIVHSYQSTSTAIAQADFMRAEVPCTEIPADRKLTIAMKRMTARVIVNITQWGDEFAGLEPTITDVRMLSRKTVPSSEEADFAWVSPYKQGVEKSVSKSGESYIALVCPEPAVIEWRSFLKIVVTTKDSEEERFRYTAGIPALEAGKSYTYNLKVGKDKVTVESVKVSERTEGPVIPGGEAEEVKATDAKALETLISKAQDNTETVIKLGESFNVPITATYGPAFSIPAGKNITIDGGGETITSSNPYMDYLFDVYGTLTLKNVKLKKTETTSAYVMVNNEAKMTLENATVEGTVNVFGGTLSLENGSTVMFNSPLNIENGGIVTFNGGVVSGTGDYDIHIRRQDMGIDYVPLVFNAKPTAENTTLRLNVHIDNSSTPVATVNYAGAKADDFSLYRWWDYSISGEITGGTLTIENNALKLVPPADE